MKILVTGAAGFIGSRTAEAAAKALKITAQDLIGMKIVDRIIPEPPGGAHSRSCTEGPCAGLKKHGGRRMGRGSPSRRAMTQATA